jgi:hypothetical protein
VKLIFLCSAFLLFIAAPLSKAETVEEMLSACRPLAEAKVSEGNVYVPHDLNDREAGICWGAFAVIQRVITWTYTEDSDQPILSVCAPEKSTRTQLIAVFVEYAKSHPHRYSEDFTHLVFDALREAFPCKVQKDKK